MIKWIIAFVLVGVFVGGTAYWAWSSSQPQILPASAPTYPVNVRFVSPNQCLGTYDNNVGVSWPAVDGRC